MLSMILKCFKMIVFVFFKESEIFHLYCSKQVNNSTLLLTRCDFFSAYNLHAFPQDQFSICSICHPYTPPSIPMFSAQREDKGSVCTCAGEHLNKCIVFVQKAKKYYSLSLCFLLCNLLIQH